MFPTVRCSFSNLRPDMKYWVLLDIVPCDNKRYRYAYHRSSWLVAGKADPPPPHRLYPHPDAPYTGEQLRKQVVSFEKVKLTNNEMDKNGQVSEETCLSSLPETLAYFCEEKKSLSLLSYWARAGLVKEVWLEKKAPKTFKILQCRKIKLIWSLCKKKRTR